MIIKFDKFPWRTSKGRNGFMLTTGIEIVVQDLPADSDAEKDDACLLFSPITSKGKTSEACRLSVAKSALPELIDALQRISGGMDNV